MGLEAYSNKNRQGRTLKQVQCPWSGYDPSCESEDGFHPITPNAGAAEFYNLARIEAMLAEAESAVINPAKSGRYKWESQHRIKRCTSWLAQLRGEPGAIPEGAGDAYREWVEFLRKAEDNG